MLEISRVLKHAKVSLKFATKDERRQDLPVNDITGRHKNRFSAFHSPFSRGKFLSFLG